MECITKLPQQRELLGFFYINAGTMIVKKGVIDAR